MSLDSSAHMSQTAVPSLGAKKAKAKAVVEEDSELLLGGEDGEEVANDDQLVWC